MSNHTNDARPAHTPEGKTATDAGERSDGGRDLGPRWRAGRRLGALLRIVAVAALVGLGAIALPAAAVAATRGISGTVTNAEAHSEPVSGADVCLYESTSEVQLMCEKTNSKGEYEILGEPEGFYKVRFVASGFATQWYVDDSTWSSARLVEVESSGVTPGIDAEMSEEGEGSIAGRVVSAANGQGAGGVEVCVLEARCVETNANGEYAFAGIRVGSTQIYFSPARSCEEEMGEKVRCVAKSDYIGQYIDVQVRANKTTSVETVALQVGGQISGTVTNASITHPPLAKIDVCADGVNGKGEFSGGGSCTYTNASGQYTVSGLEGGSYKVVFRGEICTVVKKGAPWECPESYITQYYVGQPTFQKAAAISVTAGATVGGINESLREAFPVTPASAAAPALTGTPVVGQALSCSQGSWSHEPTYLVYQWLRNGTVIPGQAGATYTLQAADQGHSITCSVLAGNGAGLAGASSNAVAVPVPLALFAGVKVKGSVAAVKLRCPGPGACAGVVKIVARVTTGRGKHKKTTKATIGSAKFSIVAGKSATVGVRLTGQGLGLLRKAGRRGLVVQIAGSGVKAHAAALKAAAAKKKTKKH